MEKSFKTTNLQEFNEMLHNGIVNFEFVKKDGTIRQAKGTLVAEHLPAPKANSDAPARKTNENVLVYFDMEKQSFRSFVKESFLGEKKKKNNFFDTKICILKNNVLSL